ncbi:hypothetical protein BJ165DRAFT_281997 [Panaeolus papilionaceus]|nr:hypothetical protein BJ165DRAFT_281997 [Panaeolus papilionaceus]
MLRKLLCNHQNTIQDLELSFSYIINPSVFLQNLPKFPVLWRFLLNQYILSLHPSSFSRTAYFVSQHRAQIRSLSLFILPHPFIHTFPPELMFNTAASATFAQFSNLNELTLGVVPGPFLPVNIRTYLEWYKPTLTSLQLYSNVWSYTQLRNILSSITPRIVMTSPISLQCVIFSFLMASQKYLKPYRNGTSSHSPCFAICSINQYRERIELPSYQPSLASNIFAKWTQSSMRHLPLILVTG